MFHHSNENKPTNSNQSLQGWCCSVTVFPGAGDIWQKVRLTSDFNLGEMLSEKPGGERPVYMREYWLEWQNAVPELDLGHWDKVRQSQINFLCSRKDWTCCVTTGSEKGVRSWYSSPIQLMLVPFSLPAVAVSSDTCSSSLEETISKHFFVTPTAKNFSMVHSGLLLFSSIPWFLALQPQDLSKEPSPYEPVSLSKI